MNKGNIVAITVPTWLPALAADLEQRQLVALVAPEGRLRQRRRARAALHRTRSSARSSATAARTSSARLLYTATYIPDPRPTVKKPKS